MHFLVLSHKNKKKVYSLHKIAIWLGQIIRCCTYSLCIHMISGLGLPSARQVKYAVLPNVTSTLLGSRVMWGFSGKQNQTYLSIVTGFYCNHMWCWNPYINLVSKSSTNDLKDESFLVNQNEIKFNFEYMILNYLFYMQT